MAEIYRLIVILSGMILFCRNLIKIAGKKMEIGLGSWWAATSLIVVVFGFAFDFTALASYAQVKNLLLLYLFVVAVVKMLYLYGMYLSRLKKETRELGILVSYREAVREEHEREHAKNIERESSTNSEQEESKVCSC